MTQRVMPVDEDSDGDGSGGDGGDVAVDEGGNDDVDEADQ